MRKEVKLVSILTYVFLAALLVYFVMIANYEFIGYAVVVGILFYLILKLDENYKFPVVSIWLFAVWIVSHMLGGLVYIGGVRLYDLVLIPIIGEPFFILRYDQLIHAFCYFAIVILVYFVLKGNMKKGSGIVLSVFAVLVAIGIGLLNEVIEFGMVVFADAGAAVGGYYNTALDLVFNLVGALIGVVFVRRVLD